MPVPASAPATPARKMPFPSEGKDDGRTIQSKKESGKGGKEAKRRVSFMDKIKAKFGSPTKEKERDKESGSVVSYLGSARQWKEVSALVMKEWSGMDVRGWSGVLSVGSHL